MFCHACKELLQNESLHFCPYCGTSLTQVNTPTQNTIVKVAKFDMPTESLFQSCIQSLNDLGITINKVDEEGKYIETIDVTKSPVGNNNRFPIIHIKVTEEG